MIETMDVVLNKTIYYVIRDFVMTFSDCFNQQPQKIWTINRKTNDKTLTDTLFSFINNDAYYNSYILSWSHIHTFQSHILVKNTADDTNSRTVHADVAKSRCHFQVLTIALYIYYVSDNNTSYNNYLLTTTRQPSIRNLHVKMQLAEQ